jgi:putative SOS response-associated peptidase YedK
MAAKIKGRGRRTRSSRLRARSREDVDRCAALLKKWTRPSCVASHFFEFTGTKSPKTKWKFTKAGEDWFCFAGLWRPNVAGGEAFTLLTADPSSDFAPIHDRQMVVWSVPTGRQLEQTGNEGNLLRALPAGSLRVEQVR